MNIIQKTHGSHLCNLSTRKRGILELGCSVNKDLEANSVKIGRERIKFIASRELFNQLRFSFSCFMAYIHIGRINLEKRKHPQPQPVQSQSGTTTRK